jgi:hypothetical protein
MLNELRLSHTSAAKQHAEALVEQMVVEGAQLHPDGDGSLGSSLMLKENMVVVGEVKPIIRKTETQYVFYRIDVPDEKIPVGLRVAVFTLSGDPDVYVCNRNTFPMAAPAEHTWRSQHAGDDVIDIPPHDPAFFPGMFYISVFALRDTQFEISCNFVPQEVRIKPPMPSEGNGYREVRAQLALADTRRRFCRNGLGFKEQLDSPRSLRGEPAANRTWHLAHGEWSNRTSHRAWAGLLPPRYPTREALSRVLLSQTPQHESRRWPYRPWSSL